MQEWKSVMVAPGANTSRALPASSGSALEIATLAAIFPRLDQVCA